ncbi:MAG: spondin domain-containing protein [Bacteroidota bacterium]
MKNITFFALTFLFLGAAFTVNAQVSVATYDIVFTSTWNDTDHGPLPLDAHWSDLVGTNHNSNVTFLELGQPATQGIEDVAETGNNTAFNAEVQAEISANNAQQWLRMAFTPVAAASSASLNDIEISSDYPLLSLASMIAPSPDWLIAVNSLNLMDTSTNTWKSSIVIDLFPHDAGTEQGFGYSYDNPVENGVITNIAGAAGYPFNANKVGTLTITLKSVLSVDEVTINNAISIHPNPTQNGQVTISNTQPIIALTIYNVLGKMVKQITYNANDLGSKSYDFSDLNDGIYVMRFTGEDGASVTKKLVKN